MNDLQDIFGYSVWFSAFISFLIGTLCMGIWFVTDEKIRERYHMRQRTRILTNREYFSVVFGIIFVAQGMTMITIYANSWSTREGPIVSIIGMSLVIIGVLLEIKTVSKLKKLITDLQTDLVERIEKLEKKDI